MLYNDVCNDNLSRLGFGTMRLPLKEDGKTIDEIEFQKMVDYAINNGINYFDTAYPYHDGHSELALGRALKKYPRDSFKIASKFPGHNIIKVPNPKEVFEEQLRKCQVEYFDYYLLHNVCEIDISIYEDPKYGIIDYFLEQKRLGRIKHLGFSSHARVENLEEFISRHEGVFEFCQIQLNYLDWTLQNGKEKYDVLTKHNIPVWVMEPVRGGKLVNDINEEEINKLKVFRNDESVASFGFRFLMKYPNIKMILSGMSNMEQMIDNIKTFNEDKPLSDDETNYLFEIAERLKDAVPCTKCHYCTKGCPMGLDIPLLIASYNDLKFAQAFTVPMQMDALSEDKKPSACINCGQCAMMCPQKIDVPKVLADFNELLSRSVKWTDVCRQRNEAEERLKKEKAKDTNA
ncbi:MAG: aldo/keto reductase [Firmicutes bacterium]|nr:aldo/keto reductase [Candidatus Colivicinus equi]